MGIQITRTGPRSFTFSDDDPTQPVLDGTYDHDADPPLVLRLRWVVDKNETWEQIDALVAQLLGE